MSPDIQDVFQSSPFNTVAVSPQTWLVPLWHYIKLTQTIANRKSRLFYPTDVFLPANIHFLGWRTIWILIIYPKYHQSLARDKLSFFCNVVNFLQSVQNRVLPSFLFLTSIKGRTHVHTRSFDNPLINHILQQLNDLLMFGQRNPSPRLIYWIWCSPVLMHC